MWGSWHVDFVVVFSPSTWIALIQTHREREIKVIPGKWPVTYIACWKIRGQGGDCGCIPTFDLTYSASLSSLTSVLLTKSRFTCNMYCMRQTLLIVDTEVHVFELYYYSSSSQCLSFLHTSRSNTINFKSNMHLLVNSFHTPFLFVMQQIKCVYEWFYSPP